MHSTCMHHLRVKHCPYWGVLISLLTLVILLAGCGKDNSLPAPTGTDKETDDLTDEEVLRIPVVVHVIYEREEFNISFEKIASQLAVLNQDFRKKNLDHLKTP